MSHPVIRSGTSDKEINKNIVSLSKSRSVFPNHSISSVRVAGTSPALYEMYYYVNNVRVFALSRVLCNVAYDIVIDIHFSPIMISMLNIPDECVNIRTPHRDNYIGAIDDALDAFVFHFDNTVNTINEQMAMGSESWVYEVGLKGLWNFRLGLSDGD